ncbi:MAG: PadR family transcriptional regulator [Candidatus Heimdallarchaeota archaeon]|nr:PadR family transcriptional regulator [Candidatus Heimdallarchaeota archaeon]MCK4769329.1 PadR family transcriptional regulator [Candidatus Heimdallarchaeota archaeon]
MPRIPVESRNKFAILGMLSHEPLTGYDLKKRMEFTIGFFWPDLSFSKIYPNLKKLEVEELVRMKKIEGENRPDRKIYTITEKGRLELKEWISLPIDMEKSRNMFSIMQELLLKLFFGGITSVEDSIEFISISAEQFKQSQNLLEQFEVNLKENLKNSDDHYYFLTTVLMGIEVSKAVISWSKKAKELLKEIN